MGSGLHISNFESLIEHYKQNSKQTDRYSSFDYCYNYFSSTSDICSDIEKSCLALSFYLASWGMLRGRSFLLQKSLKHYEPLIRYISTIERSTWSIDVDQYTEGNIESILEIYSNIKQLLIPSGHTHLVLVTKVMLGVFGLIPAYDRYFGETFGNLFEHKGCGFRTVSKDSLQCLNEFYLSNKTKIDELSQSTQTWDFKTGEKSKIRYPKAKIVDMYGFINGLKA